MLMQAPTARRFVPFIMAICGFVVGTPSAAQNDALPLFDASMFLDGATRKIQPSVFMLAELGHAEQPTSRPIGSAFLISRQHRLLATAAHVIDDSDGDGETIVAITAGGTATYRVVRTWYHPAITRSFDDGMIVRSLNPRDGPMAHYTADVAIVQLEDGGPDLPPEVRLAAELGLDAATPVPLAIFGFPQSLYPKNESLPLIPVGRGAQGYSGTDAEVEPKVGASPITISMETEPGQSGSPVFRADGTILAVVHGIGGPNLKYASVTKVECLWELIAYHHLDSSVRGFPDPAPRRFETPARLDRKKLRSAISLGHRADAALELGQFGRAKTFLDEALSLAPDFVLALTLRGEIYLHEFQGFPFHTPILDRTEPLVEARHNLMRAVTLNPRRFDNWLGFVRVKIELAELRVDQSEFEYCLSTTEILLASYDYTDEVDDVDRACTLQIRSRARAGLGDYVGAIADIEVAIALEPSAAEFRRTRASLREKAGDVDRGLMDRVAADLLGRREGFERRRWR